MSASTSLVMKFVNNSKRKQDVKDIAKSVNQNLKDSSEIDKKSVISETSDIVTKIQTETTKRFSKNVVENTRPDGTCESDSISPGSTTPENNSMLYKKKYQFFGKARTNSVDSLRTEKVEIVNKTNRNKRRTKKTSTTGIRKKATSLRQRSLPRRLSKLSTRNEAKHLTVFLNDLRFSNLTNIESKNKIRLADNVKQYCEKQLQNSGREGTVLVEKTIVGKHMFIKPTNPKSPISALKLTKKMVKTGATNRANRSMRSKPLLNEAQSSKLSRNLVNETEIKYSDTSSKLQTNIKDNSNKSKKNMSAIKAELKSSDSSSQSSVTDLQCDGVSQLDKSNVQERKKTFVKESNRTTSEKLQKNDSRIKKNKVIQSLDTKLNDEHSSELGVQVLKKKPVKINKDIEEINEKESEEQINVQSVPNKKVLQSKNKKLKSVKLKDKLPVRITKVIPDTKVKKKLQKNKTFKLKIQIQTKKNKERNLAKLMKLQDVSGRSESQVAAQDTQLAPFEKTNTSSEVSQVQKDDKIDLKLPSNVSFKVRKINRMSSLPIKQKRNLFKKQLKNIREKIKDAEPVRKIVKETVNEPSIVPFEYVDLTPKIKYVSEMPSLSNTTVVKRGRGRPRKVVSENITPKLPTVADVPPTPIPDLPKSLDKTPKRRGRPAKVKTPQDLELPKDTPTPPKLTEELNTSPMSKLRSRNRTFRTSKIRRTRTQVYYNEDTNRTQFIEDAIDASETDNSQIVPKLKITNKTGVLKVAAIDNVSNQSPAIDLQEMQTNDESPATSARVDVMDSTDSLQDDLQSKQSTSVLTSRDHTKPTTERQSRSKKRKHAIDKLPNKSEETLVSTTDGEQQNTDAHKKVRLDSVESEKCVDVSEPNEDVKETSTSDINSSSQSKVQDNSISSSSTNDSSVIADVSQPPIPKLKLSKNQIRPNSKLSSKKKMSKRLEISKKPTPKPNTARLNKNKLRKKLIENKTQPVPRPTTAKDEVVNLEPNEPIPKITIANLNAIGQPIFIIHKDFPAKGDVEPPLKRKEPSPPPKPKEVKVINAETISDYFAANIKKLSELNKNCNWGGIYENTAYHFFETTVSYYRHYLFDFWKNDSGGIQKLLLTKLRPDQIDISLSDENSAKLNENANLPTNKLPVTNTSKQLVDKPVNSNVKRPVAAMTRSPFLKTADALNKSESISNNTGPENKEQAIIATSVITDNRIRVPEENKLGSPKSPFQHSPLNLSENKAVEVPQVQPFIKAAMQDPIAQQPMVASVIEAKSNANNFVPQEGKQILSLNTNRLITITPEQVSPRPSAVTSETNKYTTLASFYNSAPAILNENVVPTVPAVSPAPNLEQSMNIIVPRYVKLPPGVVSMIAVPPLTRLPAYDKPVSNSEVEHNKNQQDKTKTAEQEHNRALNNEDRIQKKVHNAYVASPLNVEQPKHEPMYTLNQRPPPTTLSYQQRGTHQIDSGSTVEVRGKPQNTGITQLEYPTNLNLREISSGQVESPRNISISHVEHRNVTLPYVEYQRISEITTNSQRVNTSPPIYETHPQIIRTNTTSTETSENSAQVIQRSSILQYNTNQEQLNFLRQADGSCQSPISTNFTLYDNSRPASTPHYEQKADKDNTKDVTYDSHKNTNDYEQQNATVTYYNLKAPPLPSKVDQEKEISRIATPHHQFEPKLNNFDQRTYYQYPKIVTTDSQKSTQVKPKSTPTTVVSRNTSSQESSSEKNTTLLSNVEIQQPYLLNSYYSSPYFRTLENGLIGNGNLLLSSANSMEQNLFSNEEINQYLSQNHLYPNVTSVDNFVLNPMESQPNILLPNDNLISADSNSYAMSETYTDMDSSPTLLTLNAATNSTSENSNQIQQSVTYNWVENPEKSGSTESTVKPPTKRSRKPRPPKPTDGTTKPIGRLDEEPQHVFMLHLEHVKLFTPDFKFVKSYTAYLKEKIREVYEQCSPGIGNARLNKLGSAKVYMHCTNKTCFRFNCTLQSTVVDAAGLTPVEVKVYGDNNGPHKLPVDANKPIDNERLLIE